MEDMGIPIHTSTMDTARQFKTASNYIQAGQFQKAEDIYKKVLELYPGHSGALHLLGLLAYERGDLNRALELFKTAALNEPRNATIHFSMGTVLLDLGQIDRAVLSYQEAIKIRPDYADAILNMGNAFHKKRNYVKAADCYQLVLKLDSGNAKAYNNLGKTLQDQGHPEKALFYYEQALKICGNYAEARFNRSIALLITGNMIEGWKEFEWRFRRRESERIYPHCFDEPRWDGKSFSGKRLLVYSEQGLGDTIQFFRYLPRVKALGGIVIFETLKPLVELFRGTAEVDDIIAFSFDSKTVVDFDYHIPLLSLANIFQTDLDTIPKTVPYLFASPQKSTFWKNKFSKKGVNVGIVWAGKPSHGNDRNRSLALDKFAPLSGTQGINLYGLQKETSLDEELAINRILIRNFGPEFRDFTDTAGAVENLDLIISVDTSVAHLAGAMGKTVWLLLPFVPDWRWLLHRQDTPWYPTMRLFRQTKRGDWDGVIDQVKGAMEKIAHRE